MQFWRTYNNKVYPLHSVGRGKMGWPTSDPMYIPDEYLEAKDFVILRTCFGLGDWGIISAFPRKLKEKYPDCKVWIPSKKLLTTMFGDYSKQWGNWSDAYNVVHNIFDNNPYVDGFVDSYEGEIFNDHYRLYGVAGEDVALLEQMMKFWQFDDFTDIDPELYWSDDEVELGNKIIKEHCDGEFGTLLLSEKYAGDGKELIQEKIDEHDLPMFYWTKSPGVDIRFKRCLDLRNVNIRIQLYIKSKAKFNVGNQSGVNDTISKYAPTYSLARVGNIGSNFLKSEIYL